MNTRLLLPASAMALALMGLGCNPFASVQERVEKNIGQSIGEKILEGASGGKGEFEITDEGIVVKDRETGDSIGFGAGAKIPDGFPSDIPRYQGGTVSLVSMSQDKKKVVLAETFIGPDTATLTAWYDAELTKNGYVRETEAALNVMNFGEYKKGNVKISIVIGGQRTDENQMAHSVQIHREEK